MKNVILWISIALFLAACEPEYIPTPPTLVITSAPATLSPFPTNLPLSTPILLRTNIPADLTPAQRVAVASLSSTLGVSADQIKLTSTQAVIWPNGCMGVQHIGMMCTNQQVPGFVIFLDANGRQYVLHTNEDGSKIQPATLALTWTRSGGIAGFCDSLTVYLSGEVSGNNCKSDAHNGKLLPAEMTQLETWIMQFSQVNLDASDPVNVSDRMTRQLSLFGNGSTQPSEADQQALLSWAQDLYQRLYK